MAEIAFGTVASAAGLASLALQLVEGVKRLKGFYEGVKDALSDLEHLLEHLDTLDVLIREILAAEEGDPFLTNSPGFVKCMRMCQDAAIAAISLLKRLEVTIKQNKRWGGIKMVLRKDDIEKLDKRLDRAMNLLHFSCTVNGIKPFRESIRLIQSSSVTIEKYTTAKSVFKSMDNDTSLALAPDLLQSVSDGQKETDVKEIVRTFDVNTCSRGTVPRGSRTRLRLPLFFINKIWELEYSRSVCGWQARFRVSRIVPYSSAVWSLAEQADVEGIRALIINGQASLFDSDDHGWNVNMFHACQNAAFDEDSRENLTRFLDYAFSEAGKGIALPWQCLKNPLTYDRNLDVEESIYQVHRRLLPHIDFKMDLSASEYNVVTRYAGPPNFLYDIISHLDPPLQTYTRKIRLNLAIQSMLHLESFKHYQTDDFVFILGCEITDGSILEPLCSSSSTVQHIAGIFGSAMALEDVQAGLRLEKFLMLAIDHGLLNVDTHQADNSRAGLIHEFAYGYLRKKRRLFTMQSFEASYTTGMRLWLLHLAAIGVDLTKYGHAERRRRSRIIRGLDKYEPVPSWCGDRDRGFETVSVWPIGRVDDLVGFKITSFTYGPRPEDWILQFSWQLDHQHVWEQFAGSFWKMLDFEERSVPGAWKLEWHSDSNDVPSRYRKWNHERTGVPKRSMRMKLARSLAEEEAQRLGILSTPSWLVQKHKRQLRCNATTEALKRVRDLPMMNQNLQRKLQQKSLM